jgi:hypothetical protein
LVKMHQGQLAVSNPGQGQSNRILIRLPLAETNP